MLPKPNFSSVEPPKSDFYHYLEKGGVKPNDIDSIFQKALALKNEVQGDQRLRVPIVNKNHMFSVLVSKDGIHLQGAKFAFGAYNNLHYLRNFDFFGEFLGSPRALRVAKNPNQSHSPEINRVRSSEHRDKALVHYKMLEGVYNGIPMFYSHSEHKLADGCFNDFKFTESKTPAYDTLCILHDVTQALADDHANGMLHRDIKGANILFKRVEGKVHGYMSDYGLAVEAFATLNRTTGTPIYVDPMDYGSPEESLIHQKRREGKQTFAGDIFALSRTMERDVLLPLFSKLSAKYLCEESMISVLTEAYKPVTIPVDDTTSDAELKELGEKHPHLAHFDAYIKKLPDGKQSIANVVRAYHPMAERQQALLQGIALLEPFISADEASILKTMVDLMGRMQGAENRPDAQTVCNEFKQMRMQITPIEENTLPNTPEKRKFEQLVATHHSQPMPKIPTPTKTSSPDSYTEQYSKKYKCLKNLQGN